MKISVAERRHKEIVFWTKVGVLVTVFGAIIALAIGWTQCRWQRPETSMSRATPAAATPASAKRESQSPFPTMPVTTPSVTERAEVFSAASYEDVLRTLNDDQLTGLQKEEFRRSHDGRVVEWIVRVASVQRQWEHDKDSDFIVVFQSAEVKKESPWNTFAAAIFPSRLKAQMLELRQKDLIKVRGRLKFSSTTTDLPSLNDCELLSRVREPSTNH